VLFLQSYCNLNCVPFRHTVMWNRGIKKPMWNRVKGIGEKGRVKTLHPPPIPIIHYASRSALTFLIVGLPPSPRGWRTSLPFNMQSHNPISLYDFLIMQGLTAGLRPLFVLRPKHMPRDSYAF